MFGNMSKNFYLRKNFKFVITKISIYWKEIFPEDLEYIFHGNQMLISLQEEK